MKPLRDIHNRAAANPAKIVLSEGHDPRVVAGAVQAVKAGFASVVLVGPQDTVAQQVSAANGDGLSGITIEDPATSAHSQDLANLYFELRKHKGVSAQVAQEQVRDPLIFSALMVRAGLADGTIGGAVCTTSDTVRAAITMIGKAPDAALVSSFFLMVLPDNHFSGVDALVFSDCGLVIDPSAPELASIAIAAAKSYAALTAQPARVAMLSFSTKGSAHHAHVDKVAKATERARELAPDLSIDGEMQFDAAFVPAVAKTKAPDSAIAGHANVMIFPNLDAGNIGYKIAQRIGGATAIGPILQGLAKPANDLSRGCSTEDVFNMIAVTVVQAQSAKSAKSAKSDLKQP